MTGIYAGFDVRTTQSGVRPSSSEAAPGSYSADRVATQWSGVRVEDIDSHLRHERYGRDEVIVRAYVKLGTLLPADVKVDLLIDRRHADRCNPRGADHPLWSVQSYENGVFVFEGSMPRNEVEKAAGIGVRVRPFRTRDGASAPPAVIEWMEPPPSLAGTVVRS